jgi:molybdopterin-guanine dinucleotide biosynthesis protein B
MRALAFIGWSGSGKTTLLEKLLPRMSKDGRIVGYMKTDAHGFTMDRPGKDTARLFDAGASVVAILGPDEAATRFRPTAELPLEEFLASQFGGCDLILVEGGKNSTLDKVELTTSEPVLSDDQLVARAAAVAPSCSVPAFARDDIEGIARFVEDWLESQPR